MTVKSNKIVSFVRNTKIVLDLKLIGEFFFIPFTGVCPFNLKGPFNDLNDFELDQLKVLEGSNDASLFSMPKTIDVSPLSSILHKVRRSNLLPHVGGRSEITYQDLIIIAMILKQKSILLCFCLNTLKVVLKTKGKIFSL